MECPSTAPAAFGLHPRAGFVLAGGHSSRMGRDKALLEIGGVPLLELAAANVRKAAGSATVIAPPGRYGLLGLPCVADLVVDRGPLGGLYTALTVSRAKWNLVLACDMPGVRAELLIALFEAAEESGHPAVVPRTAAGLEPLCAVYHRDVLPFVATALRENRLRMHDFVASLDALLWPAPDGEVFRGANTPAEWSAAMLPEMPEAR